MKVISVVNQKGGSGKTTVALHLAVSASLTGLNTAVIDLDPQASAANWGDRRQAEQPVVRPAFASRISQELGQIERAGGDLIVIDTAPHADSAALEAAKVSDLILIPCRPAYFDLEAMTNTLGLLRTTDKRGVGGSECGCGPGFGGGSSSRDNRGLRCSALSGQAGQTNCVFKGSRVRPGCPGGRTKGQGRRRGQAAV